MTGGNAPLGRRDNGLHAADYAVVGDVDPRVGEHLLEVLGDRGIAAYLRPTVDQDPVTRSAMLPRRPLDRLFVASDGLSTARRLMADAVESPNSALTDALSDLSEDADSDTASALNVSAAAVATSGEHPPPARESDEFEAAWASIVASYKSAAPTEAAPWPASEDVSGSATPPKPDRPKVVPRFTDERTDRSGPSILDGLDTFGANLPDDEDEDDFQPPPPPPLPRLAMVTIVGVLGIVVGFLAVVEPDWFASILPPSTAPIFGGVALVAGTALLIGRLRSGSEEDDDPDQGARI